METKNPQNTTNRKKDNSHKDAYSNLHSLVKTSLFGVGITNETSKNILEYIVKFLRKTQKNMYIVTPNPEMIMLAQKNSTFKNTLNEANLALCDGIGLFRGGQLVGRPMKERIIGTDFVERLCERVADWPITVGFLGGGPGVAERAAECLKARYPGLKVVFAEAEWPENDLPRVEKCSPHLQHDVQQLLVINQASSPASLSKSRLPKSNSKVQMPTFDSVGNGFALSKSIGGGEYKNAIPMQNTKYKIPNTDRIDILFVAFGAPKQESWMAEHINKVPVRVMMGVGGALDQIVDRSLRPPILIHTLGLGWLYRLAREPWRIKRQAALVPFMWLVLKEKLK